MKPIKIVTKTNFLIKSENLENLTPRIDKTVKLIKKALAESRPILIRHHADCDGYSGAIALERAILPLIKSDKTWLYYKRLPTPTPFYDYIDAIKDITNFVQTKNKWHVQEPLIILLDNGSCEEDILAIKQIKMYNAQIAIIDHHFPSKETDNHVDAHVNAYLEGADNNITAGMLGCEIANKLNPNIDTSYLPALSGIGDRSDCSEFEEYLKLANKTKEELLEIAEVLDYLAYNLKFMNSNLIEDLLGLKQKEIISLLLPIIKEKKTKRLESIKKYIKIEDKEIIRAELEIMKITDRNFPPIGKTTGMAFDYLKSKYDKPILVIAHAKDLITIRTNADFNLPKKIKELQEKLPHANIDGGGHENAGTIKFIEAAKDEVLEYLK